MTARASKGSRQLVRLRSQEFRFLDIPMSGREHKQGMIWASCHKPAVMTTIAFVRFSGTPSQYNTKFPPVAKPKAPDFTILKKPCGVALQRHTPAIKKIKPI